MGTWKKDSRDEDLALFHDMRRRERRKFLIPSAEDAEASPMSTPTRTGRELLASDSEKSDFDWLLTPPSTPLFPSLDQDGPIVNLSHRRILARSDSVSRPARLSYTREPSSKVVRCGNPSSRGPNTVSIASSTTITAKARPLSPSFTDRSSPNLRSSSPCRPVTPTRRNSAVSCRSSSRSLTPTLQRNDTSLSSANRAGLPCGRRGGKSLSPKLGPREPSLPGCSAEPPPPNLRTSLSDRTFQRGVECVSKNRSKTRTVSADMIDASNEPQWKLESPDVSRKWRPSYSIDHSSSQNSRASVISYEEDVEMAESALSGSTISDGISKVSNSITPKMDDTPLRRSVLPAKRQMKSARSGGDAMPFLSVAARKSYERQTALRRSPQAMFRPLLSSAPITSFYNSRTSGIHLHSSGPFTDPSTAQSTDFRGSRNDVFPVETATGVSRCNENCKPVRGCQETMEVENEGSSILEEEATSRCEGNCCLRASEERHACHLTQSDNIADGHKVSTTINGGNHPLTSAKRNEGPHILGAVTGILQVQCLTQTPQDRKVQPEDTSCIMDLKVTKLSSPTDSNAKSICTCQEQHSCTDEQVASSISTEISQKGDLKSHESKVTENYVEDQKLSTSGKAHASFLETVNVLPQHGSQQRVLSDLGSFRKQSLVKALHTRLHDSMPFGEQNGSCGSSLSDSRSLTANFPSANGSCQFSDCESAGCSVVGNTLLGSNAIGDKSYHYIDRISHASGRDTSKNIMQFCANLAGAVDDVSKNDVNSEGINRIALSTGHATSNHLELRSLEMGSMNLSSFALSCRSSENLQTQASTSDKFAQHDGLSEIGSCVSAITSFDKDGVQYRCTETGSSELIMKSFDISTAAGLAGDTSHRGDDSLRRSLVNRTAADLAGEAFHADDLTQRHAQGVLLSKRSVTLEEATDTILFCSSIVHELVYKAAAMAIDNENQRISKPSISRRDFVALFGFSGAENKHDNRSSGLKMANRARNRVHRPPTVGTVCETSSFVQKQRMIHRQTPALTMRQNPMERIENAILGNHKEMHTSKPVVLAKKKIKLRRRDRCRCSCCMM